jgi:molybdopterin-containing oxidoreductase family membrane subunit
MNLRSKPISAAYYVGLIVVIVAGFYAIYVRATKGLSVTALTSLVPWGAWVSWYIFFVGLSAGLIIISSLFYVFKMKKYEPVGRDALLIATISLILSLIFISIDLGRLDRGFLVLMYRNITSLLSWEAHLFLIFAILLIAGLYFAMRTDLIKIGEKSRIHRLLSLGIKDTSEKSMSRDKKILRILGAIAIPIALAIQFSSGALFAGVKARIFWFSPLVPIIFITSALVASMGVLIFLRFARIKISGREIDKDLFVGLGKFLLLFLVIDVFFIISEYFTGFYGLIPEHLVILDLILRGPYSGVFWIVQIAIGVILPIILITYSAKTKFIPGIIIGAICATLGIAALRFIIVIPALSIPVIVGMPTGAFYFPTLIEWVSSIGVIALGLLLYSIGTRVLPMDNEGGS